MNNVCILAGRICRNLELKKTQSGMSVCNVTLAIPRSYKNSEGIYESDFITCVCYRNTAEMVAEYCQKGDLIGIKGMIQSRTYEKDGKKIYTTEIIVERATFLSSAKKEVKEKEEVKEEKQDPFDKAVEEFANEVVLDDESLPF